MKKSIGYLEFFKDLIQTAYAEGHFHDPYTDVSCHCQHGCECRNKGIERCYRLVMESLDWLLKKKKEQD